MPRALIVHPGPAFSVADVYNGWRDGLNACGWDVMEVNLDTRLQFFANAHLATADGTFVPAMSNGAAAWAAAEAVKGHAYDWWPDLVVVISAFFWDGHLTNVIRERGHRLVMVMTESPYEDDAQIARAADTDLVVINDPTNIDRYQAAGLNPMYVPHSYNPALHRPGPAVDALRSDVCIVGTGYPSRVAHLERVDWAGLDLALTGMWTSLDGHLLAAHVRTPDGDPADGELEQCCDNDQTVRWYNSTRASINLYRREADRPELSAGWSMGPREIELAASGTFFVGEARGENEQVMPFVPKIDDPAETGDVLRWWLAHDREREQVIAQARAAVDGWTFTARVGEVLRRLDRLPVKV